MVIFQFANCKRLPEGKHSSVNILGLLKQQARDAQMFRQLEADSNI